MREERVPRHSIQPILESQGSGVCGLFRLWVVSMQPRGGEHFSLLCFLLRRGWHLKSVMRPPLSEELGRDTLWPCLGREACLGARVRRWHSKRCSLFLQCGGIGAPASRLPTICLCAKESGGIPPHSGWLVTWCCGQGSGFVLDSVKLNKYKSLLGVVQSTTGQWAELIVGRRWKFLDCM